MAGRVLLDTNVIIAFLSGDRSVSDRIAESEILVSSTVLGELYYGARRSAYAPVNLSRIDQLAASVEVLSCDAVTAQHYGPTAWPLRPARITTS